jgi:hypothetical protein
MYQVNEVRGYVYVCQGYRFIFQEEHNDIIILH